MGLAQEAGVPELPSRFFSVEHLELDRERVLEPEEAWIDLKNSPGAGEGESQAIDDFKGQARGLTWATAIEVEHQAASAGAASTSALRSICSRGHL